MHRTFRWRASLTLALGLLALVTLLAGCTTSSVPQPLPDAKQIFLVNEKVPKNGDLVRLDPQLLYYQSELVIAKEIFVGLLTLDKSSKIVGDGAQSWAVSPDGLTYTFNLRPHLKWSDGSPLTAKDFAYALGRSQDPCINKGKPSLTNYYLGGTVNELLVGAKALEGIPCPKNADGTFPSELPSNPIVGPGKAIDPVDDATLILRISRPAPYFTAVLTVAASMVVPQALVRAGGFNWSQDKLCGDAAIAAGSFKCALWDHAGHLKLVRNDAYYGGKAKMREIDYTFYKDTASPFADYQAGRGTIAYPAPIFDLSQAAEMPGFHQSPLTEVDYLEPNWALSPFNDLDARIAFDAALDRTKLSSSDGMASQPTLHFIVRGLPGYNPHLKTSWGTNADDPQALHGDMAAAQAHMATYVARACGGDITKCPPIEYDFGEGFPTAQAFANAILAMWQAAFPGYAMHGTPPNGPDGRPLAIAPGITIKSVGRGSFIDDPAYLQLPAAGWLVDYPADEDIYDNLLTASASQNQTRIGVLDADDLVKLANVDPDSQAAIAIYQQAEQEYVSQVAWFVTDQPVDSYILRTNVAGYSENDLGYVSPDTLLAFQLLTSPQGSQT